MTEMTETDLVTVGRDPDEWALARVTRSVAAVVERRGWDAEVAAELLSMLGVSDEAAIKRARAGLAASRTARKWVGPTGLSRPAHRSFHLRERPMPRSVPSPFPPGLPEPQPIAPQPYLGRGGGLAAVLAGPIEPDEPLICKRGHELSGTNVIRRPDKTSMQCRECTNERKRRYRARNTRWKLEKGGRDGIGSSTPRDGMHDMSSAGEQSVVAPSDVGVSDV
jgi:hypothetical protein